MPPRKLNGREKGYIGDPLFKKKYVPKPYEPQAWLITYKIERDILLFKNGLVTKEELSKLSYWNEDKLNKI